MYLSSSALRGVAWSAIAFSAAQASYIIDSHSFGQDGKAVSPNLRAIPHFNLKGEAWDPEIHSDRVILTPPWPGNKRGALWSEEPLHHAGDWQVDLAFRVSGMDRGGGNLQLWYTRDSQKDSPPASLYTANKFDGLVLVIDQYEGRGGSIRGFLNDGNMDIKAHSDPDTLSFGQCDYAYRNLGALSNIRLKQAHGTLEVTIDGRPCFSTNKVKLPEGYYFGISASSAENPDSFEIHRFIVSTTNTYTREEPGSHHQQQQDHQQQSPDKVPPRVHQAYRQMLKDRDQQRHDASPNIPQMVEDVFAANIKSQQDQFEDLHNRIQIITHRIDDLFDMLDQYMIDQDERFNQIMGRMTPMHDQVSAIQRNVEKVERTSMETLRDLESKDFKDMIYQLHLAVEQGHTRISSALPTQMADVVGKHGPSMTTFLFIAVAMQIMVLGAWRVYKARRHGAPKKYL
ncbi:unnamed protein product [Periconia digitata]|uniref:L-type lectin-like domain-containing protein n=1 Tax=Periconia digitata TaxID=1303443 RepID=A0A9W4UGV6_9PLEO|nr:unnamed protein product [Periconia digitata]